jgi:hypothetical protein
MNAIIENRTEWGRCARTRRPSRSTGGISRNRRQHGRGSDTPRRGAVALEGWLDALARRSEVA